MVYVNLRSLIYHHLQPFAKAAGCQLYIADAATHKSWRDSLEKKAKVLGFEEDEVRELYDAIGDWGCIAILKSKKYLGAPEIAPFFSKVGLESQSIHYLSSKNAKNHKVWGDLDATIPPDKRMFFYWFIVRVEDGDGGYVYDDYLNESKMTRIELDNFYDALKNSEVEFDFIKKDGTKRHARGTLDPKLMPSEADIRKMYADQGEDYDALVAKLDARKDFMPYFWDLDKNGYRQFHVSRFEGANIPLS